MTHSPVNSKRLFLSHVKVKSKAFIQAQMAHGAGASIRFHQREAARTFATHPGWDASPSQGLPPAWYPFVQSKVSCLRTQHNDHGQGSNPDHLIRSRAHWPWGHRASTYHMYMFVSLILAGFGAEWNFKQIEKQVWNDRRRRYLLEFAIQWYCHRLIKKLHKARTHGN